MRYSAAEMGRRYRRGEIITFARGLLTIRVEEADGPRYCHSLVELDHASDTFRRLCPETGLETAIVNEARARERMKAGTIGRSAWSSSRTK